MNAPEDCVFCKIVAGRIPSMKIYEDESLVAFMDINPLNTGHLLVVPKEHFESVFEIDSELYGSLYAALARIAKAVETALGPDGATVMQLNGQAANQVVPHLHVHLVPRTFGDGLSISSWQEKSGDMDKIREIAEKIKSRL